MGKHITNTNIIYANHDQLAFLLKYDSHIPAVRIKEKIKSKEILIIEMAKNPIGFLRYNLFWDEHPFLNLIFILEDYRNQGFGTNLMTFWEREMKEKKF
jgi:GNAT superfamily N-acetyltransferase